MPACFSKGEIRSELKNELQFCILYHALASPFSSLLCPKEDEKEVVHKGCQNGVIKSPFSRRTDDPFYSSI